MNKNETYVSPWDLEDIISHCREGGMLENPLVVWCAMPQFLRQNVKHTVPDARGFVDLLSKRKNLLSLPGVTEIFSTEGLSLEVQKNKDSESEKINLIVASPMLFQCEEIIARGVKIQKDLNIPIIFLLHPDYETKIQPDSLKGCTVWKCVDVGSQELMENKEENLKKWLNENPGKNERDWLLEERCLDETERERFKNFLKWIDDTNQKISICPKWEIWNGYEVYSDFSFKGIPYDLGIQWKPGYDPDKDVQMEVGYAFIRYKLHTLGFRKNQIGFIGPKVEDDKYWLKTNYRYWYRLVPEKYR